MTNPSIDLGAVEHLATTLDGIDLAPADRATLHTVFALAGQGATDRAGDDVTGFGLVVHPPTGGLMGSFMSGEIVIEIVGRPPTGAGE
jgi:hypothetical protein